MAVGEVREGVRADQHHDAGKSQHKTSHTIACQMLAGYEEVGEPQGRQRHHGHQDAGQTAVDEGLAPGNQGKRQDIAEHGDQDIEDPEPRPGDRPGREHPGRGDEQHRGHDQTSRDHQIGRQTADGDLGQEEGCAPHQGQRQQHDPIGEAMPPGQLHGDDCKGSVWVGADGVRVSVSSMSVISITIDRPGLGSLTGASSNRCRKWSHMTSPIPDSSARVRSGLTAAASGPDNTANLP